MDDAGQMGETKDVAIYTTAELAKMLRIDPATVRTNAHRGKWPHLEFGPKTIRFTADQVAQIIELCTAKPPAPPVERRIGTLAERRRVRGR